jgi:hypothetical protein
MSRGLWFVAGAGAGIYAMARARRAAELLTPEGWSDRLSGLNLGVQLFAEHYRAACDTRESELRQRLGLDAEGPLAVRAGDRPDHPTTLPDRPKELN